MNQTSPFLFLRSLAEAAADRLQPPQWLADEAHLRLILLANHVLAQEPEAQARLSRRQASVIEVRWNRLQWQWRITPAGLLERADGTPDLVMSLDGHGPVHLFKLWIDGQRPPVQIEGDVQLAAEVAWLADNLRWDVEEDLARVLGDVPAHALVDAGRRLMQALRPFIVRATRAPQADAQGLGAGA
jgi:ubiquinone biosynthesis accessory factor UbiJ